MLVKDNIWKLYIIKGLMWFMVAMPIIVLFFQENGLSLQEVMILQGSYSLMVALMEIPSGYIADLFGRKKTMVLGTFFCFLGFSLFSFSFGFWEFLLAEILLGVGNSFISGSDSAILYDSLLQSKQTEQYTKIEGKTYSIGNFAEAGAGILGGFLAEISLRYPWYVQGIVAALAIPFAISLVEPQVKRRKLEKSFKAILHIVRYTLVENKLLKWFTLFSAITGVATLSMAWFAQPFFKDVDIPIKWFGILWAILNFSVGISSYHAHRFESILNRNNLLLFIGLGISFCYAFLGFSNTKWGVCWILMIYLIRGVATPVLRNYINEITSSEIRATVLSVRSFIIRASFALTAPFLGWIADVYTIGESFWILGALVGGMGVLCSWKLITLSKH
tara:strand:- start:2129 stop:3298 length:1170 start_codon:yes stop_codon:yes gene_type:complete